MTACVSMCVSMCVIAQSKSSALVCHLKIVSMCNMSAIGNYGLPRNGWMGRGEDRERGTNVLVGGN